MLKYNRYKKCHNAWSISTILLSTGLTLIESCKLIFISDENDQVTRDFFDLSPIFIGTVITCTSSIVKFKKYQEKMENMQFTREKVILAISKIKHIQELLWFSKENDLESIKKRYIDDIYRFYNDSNSELERHIKYSDHAKLPDTKK